MERARSRSRSWSRAAGPRWRPRAVRARRCRRRPSAPAAPARSISASKASPPLMWRTASTRSPPLASRIAAPRSSARESTVASAPSSRDQLALLLAGGEADHLRAGPLGDLHRERAGAAGGGLDDDRLARLDPGAALDQRHRGQALQQHRRRLVVVDLVGNRDQQRLRHDDLLGVAAAAEQRRDAAAVGGAAADLGARDQRQRLLGEVVVAGGVGVGEVDAGAGDLDQDLALAGRRVVELDVARAPRARRTPGSGSPSSAAESRRAGARLPSACR